MQKKELVRGLPHIKFNLPSCKACHFGKQAKLSFQKGAWRANIKLQLIHTYVVGPHKTLSLNGSKYYIVFIDDYTRMCWNYFLRFKSEVAGVFFKFKNWIENQSNFRIQVLRSDKEKEYTSNEFDKFYEEVGIEHQLTVSYTLQHHTQRCMFFPL